MKRELFVLITASILGTSTLAATINVPVYKVAKTGHGASVGQVIFTDTKYGMLITPYLHGLTPGLHGFHIHVKPDCDDYGLAAKGHFDPEYTNKHLGPYNSHGHLGDLPVLYVNKNGVGNVPTLAPRLHVKQIIGHSLMIHADGDNYSDMPKPLGGGGKRVACSVITNHQ